jgi:hypothetical protein
MRWLGMHARPVKSWLLTSMILAEGARRAIDAARLGGGLDRVVLPESPGGGVMSIEVVRGVLLWSAAINYGLLVFWATLFLFARDWSHRVGRWYRMSSEQMDVIQIAAMSLYKIGILLFNLVPYIALRIVT